MSSDERRRREWLRTVSDSFPPRVEVVCEVGHAKPHRVIAFTRSDSGEWFEDRAPTAATKRQANAARERASEAPEGGFDLDVWISSIPAIGREHRGLRLEGDRPAGTPEPGRPPSGILDELTSPPPLPDWFQDELDAREASRRDAYPIKCSRCGDGRWRRAERLAPVLDALHAIGKTRVTIPEFWLVADEMDSPRRR